MFYRVTDVSADKSEQSWNITPVWKGCVYRIDSKNTKSGFQAANLIF
jgi:hypothetical protein